MAEPAPSSVRRRVEIWAQIAGLAATCWVVWEFSLAGSSNWFFKLTVGIQASIEAWIWAGITVFLLRMIVRHLSNLEVTPATLRASTAGVWFAPAALLMADQSIWGVTTASILVIQTSRLLAVPAAETPGQPVSAAVLGAGELPIDLFAHHFGAALVAAAGLEAALALHLGHHRLPAAALLVISIAVIATLAIGLGVAGRGRTPNLPRSVMGLCLTVLLALLGGRVIRGWENGAGHGAGNSSTGSADRAGGPSREPTRPQPLPPNANLPGTYPGVILWPEVKPVVTLIEPLPSGHRPTARPSHPLGIPFGGEYWMYRSPYRRPPPNSFLRRGTPTALAFSTPDAAPLNMEARQRLEGVINLRCCHSIDVQILNGDRTAGDTWLELFVGNAGTVGPPYESLGYAPIHSQPESREGHTVPTAETLSFPIPASLPFEQFDEFRVVFHRAITRSRSARIAIDRFVLVP